MSTVAEVTDEMQQAVRDGLLILVRHDEGEFQMLDFENGSSWVTIPPMDGEGFEQELEEDGDIPGTEGDGEDKE